MLIFILTIVLLIAAIALFTLTAWDFAEGVGIFFMSLIIGIPTAILVWLSLSWLVALPMDKHYSTEKKQLSALQDSNQTQGAFFLGIGTIDGEPTYTYYRSEGSGYKLENSDADTVTVYQDTNKPYLVRQTNCNTSMEWLAWCASDKRVTEIHVPKNTIKQNFVLDAK